MLPVLPVPFNRPVQRPPVLANPLSRKAPPKKAALQAPRRLNSRIRVAQSELPQHVQTTLDVRTLPARREGPVLPQCRDNNAQAVELVRECGVEETVGCPEADVCIARGAQGRPFEGRLGVQGVVARAFGEGEAHAGGLCEREE